VLQIICEFFWQGRTTLVHAGILVNQSKFLSPIKTSSQSEVVVLDDDEDFDMDESDSRMHPVKAKRKLPFDNSPSPKILGSKARFGRGTIDEKDSHRPDVGLFSAVARSDRRQLVTSVFSETVKWIAVEPSSKVWVDKKHRAMTEDMRMIAKPVGKHMREWVFQVLFCLLTSTFTAIVSPFCGQVQGTKGDKYIVTIGTSPSCNCLGFTRQLTTKLTVLKFSWCKHILFLLSQKLGLSESPMLHQKALTEVIL